MTTSKKQAAKDSAKAGGEGLEAPPALAIVYRSPDELIPYARNARRHTPTQVQRIAGSIREFGFVNPILLDGERGIIAGHGRLEAAKMLGLQTVPTVQLAHLSPLQAKALVLADNRLAELSDWDDEMLKLELSELQEVGVDISVAGFDLDEGFDDPGDAEGSLPDGDHKGIETVTFTVSTAQAEAMKEALELAKAKEPKDPAGLNTNSAGNAAWLIFSEYACNNSGSGF